MARRKKSLLEDKEIQVVEAGMPMLVDGEEKRTIFAASRTEPGQFSQIKNEFANLDTFASPFCSSNKYFDTTEAIRLCIKAYWAFPLLRNTVEVMGELANSNVYLKGGNKKTRDFIEAWWERIGFWQLKEQFFREWFRSGNVMVLRFDGDFTKEDLNKMTQIYGEIQKTIPIKYVLLNPTKLKAGGDIVFNEPTYYLELSQYEIERLKTRSTEQEKKFWKQLSKEEKEAITNNTRPAIKLDARKLSVLLYKAQPYEPMGVPMAYGVLKDIENKLELKRIDLSIARTTDRAMLLITVGETPNGHHKGNNFNPQTLAAIQGAFQNEGIARTLIADWTVKAGWHIPEIDKILGKEKYEQLDKDISIGLNAIIFDSDEKFANTHIKIQVFIERLNEARNAFLRNFLQPEIVRVCESIGAKSYPTAFFEDLSFKDEIQYSKLAVQMAQLGFLTPEELYETLQSGKLPSPEESLESQKKFKDLREEGLYMPILGGSTEIQKGQLAIDKYSAENDVKMQSAAPVGRPKGAKAPRVSTVPSPIGKSKSSISLAKLHRLFPIISGLQNEVDKALKKKWKLKEFNADQAKLSQQIVGNIISNEPEDKWSDNVKAYIIEPKDISEEAAREIEDIQIKHDVDYYQASILRLAQYAD